MKLKEEGKMLETAEFGSNLYGTSRKAVQEDEAAPGKHRCCVLDIEMEVSPSPLDFSLIPGASLVALRSSRFPLLILVDRIRVSSSCERRQTFPPATSSSRPPQPRSWKGDYDPAELTPKTKSDGG